MPRFYRLKEPRTSRYTGDISVKRRWSLPGLRCPECKQTASGGFIAYPSVDLSSLPERAEYAKSRVESFDEFVRLREQVRPFVSPAQQLIPGVCFGPLMGTATGTFSALSLHSLWTKLIERAALEQLQAEGVQGLRGFPTELRFRQKKHPELVELEILPHGRLHIDCLPPGRPPKCLKCGRNGFKRPDDLILDAASLPVDLDLFRLSDFETTFICTERFVDAVRRLELHEAVFRELPLR